MQRLADWWLRFTGPFTKEGEWVDWDEVHSAELGLLAGLRRTGLNESFDRDQARTDYDLEWHYYKYAYVTGNRAKYIVGTLLALAGVQAGGIL